MVDMAVVMVVVTVVDLLDVVETHEGRVQGHLPDMVGIREDTHIQGIVVIPRTKIYLVVKGAQMANLDIAHHQAHQTGKRKTGNHQVKISFI